MDTDVIIVSDLVKNFGKFTALDHLNLNVKQGEVHGFLGPNGAGKSTTIRVLLGILRKTSGEVKLFGQDPWQDAVELHKRLAYIPGDVDLWPNLTGGEAIDLLGSFRGGLDKNLREELIEEFNLDPRKKCHTYSKGNRQKVAIISALASDVELYVLDEPTSGLDPLMQAIFQKYIGKIKNKGKTILLSSHILAEVEALCDKITIIKEGKAVETGTLNQLRHLRNTSITVETLNPIKDLDKLKVFDINTNENRTTFKVTSQDLDAAIKHISQFGIKSLVSAPPTLEELFIQYYDVERKES